MKTEKVSPLGALVTLGHAQRHDIPLSLQVVGFSIKGECREALLDLIIQKKVDFSTLEFLYFYLKGHITTAVREKLASGHWIGLNPQEKAGLFEQISNISRDPALGPLARALFIGRTDALMSEILELRNRHHEFLDQIFEDAFADTSRDYFDQLNPRGRGRRLH